MTTQSTISEEELKVVKKIKSDDTNTFLDWCNAMQIFIDYDKVKITKQSTSHNYGMIAIKDIDADQLLARIPKSSILQPKTTAISELIEKHANELKSDSNWSKLILSLMYECNTSKSKWNVYLREFPDYDEFDLPMFWSENELCDLLANTAVPKSVSMDLEKMRTEFDKIILPFLDANKQVFTNEKCFDFDYYKKIVGFIMAYSFRDPDEDPEDVNSIGPMMVPVGDILNHIAKNNAHLNFTEHELQIVSTKPIKANEEVYNTYGEHANADLLHMYGFVETYPNNTYDAVEIPVSLFVYAFKTSPSDQNQPQLIESKVIALQNSGLISEDEDEACFIIGVDGILNEEECLHILQVCSMTNDEFDEWVDNDYELLDDEEWDEFSLSNDNLDKLPIDWKTLLTESSKSHLKKLSESLNKLEALDPITANMKRLTNARTLIQGHILILKSFLKYIH